MKGNEASVTRTADSTVVSFAEFTEEITGTYMPSDTNQPAPCIVPTPAAHEDVPHLVGRLIPQICLAAGDAEKLGNPQKNASVTRRLRELRIAIPNADPTTAFYTARLAEPES